MRIRNKLEKQEKDSIKLSLLTILCNATGIYRKTIGPEKKEVYKTNLIKIIKELIEKTDSNSITNKEIRETIVKLSKNTGVSIGASQKAINVYLKFYCIISNKSDEIIEKLDCPIDSRVISKNKLKKITLRNLNQEDYEEMQNKLKEKYGIRILADVEAWDITKVY